MKQSVLARSTFCRPPTSGNRSFRSICPALISRSFSQPCSCCSLSRSAFVSFSLPMVVTHSTWSEVEVAFSRFAARSQLISSLGSDCFCLLAFALYAGVPNELITFGFFTGGTFHPLCLLYAFSPCALHLEAVTHTRTHIFIHNNMCTHIYCCFYL